MERGDLQYGFLVAVRPVTDEKLDTWLPLESGDEVLVAFERGDLRFPFVLGSLSRKMETSPLSADGQNNIRRCGARNRYKLTFDEGAKGLLQLELDDGKRLTIHEELVEIDDGKGNA